MYISIPYGAIKRTNKNTDEIDIFKISIPYGAIKSILLKQGRGIATKFQFLMVRLKDNNVLKQIDALTKFQFLMVRLKGFCIIFYK